jgi:putative methylase
VDKKELEILLEKCSSYAGPRADMEQYTTPTSLAAMIIYHAYLSGDIGGKRVYDLGCGTGIFAIGCALMGAKEVKGFDVDGEALAVAQENAEKMGVSSVTWVKADVKDISGKCDTVFQNPPFGVRRAKADRGFLDKALEVGIVVYTVHKAVTREFVSKYVESRGGIITDVIDEDFVLPKSYDFHRRDRKKIRVSVYRVKRSD